MGLRLNKCTEVPYAIQHFASAQKPYPKAAMAGPTKENSGDGAQAFGGLTTPGKHDEPERPKEDALMWSQVVRTQKDLARRSGQSLNRSSNKK